MAQHWRFWVARILLAAALNEDPTKDNKISHFSK